MNKEVKITRQKPEVIKSRTMVDFSKEKLAEVLEQWCIAQGMSLPSGMKEVWGLENHWHGDKKVTLVIEED